MNQGLELVRSALISSLEDHGLAAVAAMGTDPPPDLTAPVAAVGLRTGESRPGAMASYLGERVDPATQMPREIYGLQAQLTLSLDLYSPRSLGVRGCDSALEILHQVLLSGLPSGLRPTGLKWEEPVWDDATGMFLRRGSLDCQAYFLASSSEEGARLTDFILKGVVSN